ncbi:hypothetical protein CVT26_003338 [Gymnopilus dilepis]|uniref:lytic cellulose monooxygenase (C4-dehydrogenating) n=1 Tax=Gymnopilus dilepis TaxID=231916 RepID=A0A409W2T0_9AGAR|nr:hypothetical protein CVT26_003338 [Gymnopilus dilepis]
MIPTSSLLIPLLFATYASAHGFVYKLGVNTQTYTGNLPGATPSEPSVIREISTQDPVKGASNPSLTCGMNSTAGTLVADVMPGDAITFDWRGGGLDNWPHNTGPMLTYMANCGSTTCDKFDITQAKWFKTQQLGMKDANTWYLASVAAGAVANSSIPSTLAPGNYLIRHEIIALQIAVSMGGAEFYPSCSQLRVGGSQTGAPQASELVSLPGAYSDSDPGIYTPDVYNPGFQYVFPGPPVAAFVGSASASVGGTQPGSTGSGSGSGSGSGGNGTAPATTASVGAGSMPASPTDMPSSSKTCRVVRGSSQATLQARHANTNQFMRKLGLSPSVAGRR